MYSKISEITSLMTFIVSAVFLIVSFSRSYKREVRKEKSRRAPKKRSFSETIQFVKNVFSGAIYGILGSATLLTGYAIIAAFFEPEMLGKMADFSTLIVSFVTTISILVAFYEFDKKEKK